MALDSGHGGFVRVDVEAFLQHWSGREGVAARANCTMFLGELCDVLGVSRSDPADLKARGRMLVLKELRLEPRILRALNTLVRYGSVSLTAGGRYAARRAA